MTMNSHPRTCTVVMGSSDGIGRACAEAMAEHTKHLVIHGRDPNKLAAVRDAILADIRTSSSTLGVHIVVGDTKDPTTLQALISKANELGGCDALVINGGGPPPGDVLSISAEAWKQGFSDVALPALQALQMFVPPMVARKAGAVVIIGSVSAKQPIDNLDISNFMRPGLAAVMKTLARKVAVHGVSLNMVCPGSILTERSRGRIQARAQQQGVSFEASLATSEANIPMKRLGTPAEVAHAVTNLLKPQGSYITGTVLMVDGGLQVGL
jgi:3-oxoacyl-[acyl-carrier protein] reductase